MGTAVTWVFLHFPGIESVLGSTGSVTKAVVAVVTFAISTGLMAFFHNKVIAKVLEDIQKVIGVETTVIPTGKKPR